MPSTVKAPIHLFFLDQQTQKGRKCTAPSPAHRNQTGFRPAVQGLDHDWRTLSLSNCVRAALRGTPAHLKVGEVGAHCQRRAQAELGQMAAEAVRASA